MQNLRPKPRPPESDLLGVTVLSRLHNQMKCHVHRKPGLGPCQSSLLTPGHPVRLGLFLVQLSCANLELGVQDSSCWHPLRARHTETVCVSPPPRMATVKEVENNKCWRKCGETGALGYCGQEWKMVQPLWKAIWSFLRNIKTELVFDPAIPLLGTCAEALRAGSHRDICTLCSRHHYSQ